MKEDHHIDMSGRFYEKGVTGISCVSSDTKNHNGCSLKGRTKRYLEKNLFTSSIHEEYAKLYAICIYFLIKNKLENMNTLIICNDENFIYVKKISQSTSKHITQFYQYNKHYRIPKKAWQKS